MASRPNATAAKAKRQNTIASGSADDVASAPTT